MSKIQWTDKTWNPVRGCSRVSAGCVNCYAERQAARFAGSGQPYEGLVKRVGGEARWTGKILEVGGDTLTVPLRWRKPRRVFVNSMSDLFHENLPDEAIDRVFAVMALARRHTFQCLTKRPERMLAYMNRLSRSIKPLEAVAREIGYTFQFEGIPLQPWPLPNVWLGVSVEDQTTADERIPLLLETPAAIRFVSYEPALGTVDFGPYIGVPGSAPHHQFVKGILRDDWKPPLHWLIIGGESGPKARPFDLAWAQSVIAQCKAAKVPVFVKQLGARPVGLLESRPGMEAKLRDRKGGDPAEWPEDLRVREFPKAQENGGWATT